MKITKKILILLLMLPSTILANEICTDLDKGINNIITGQSYIYCFDYKIDTVNFANIDIDVNIKDKNLYLSNYNEGDLFNMVISLKNGELIKAYFLTVKSPKVKNVSIISPPSSAKITKITVVKENRQDTLE